MVKMSLRLLVLTLSTLVVVACAAPAPVVQEIQPTTAAAEVTEEGDDSTATETMTETIASTATTTPADSGQSEIGGDLILYACLIDPEKLQVLFDQFREQTGVTATCLDMSSGEALERIRAEQENPQGDVLFGTTNLSHVNMALDGLSQPYQGVGWNLLPEGPLKDPEGYWTGFYYGVIGFACSPERLEELGAECPTSWQDLLDPVYQGEIVVASPASSGTAYTVLSGLLQLYGEDEAFAYWQQLDANIAQYTESGSAPGRMAATGEYAVGIAFTHDIQTQQDEGLPVEISFPEEGTPFEIGGISIIQGAKNLAAAQAWVDFVFTPEFQRYHNDVAHRIPVVPGVELAEGTVGLEDVLLIDGYDPTQWAAERDRIIERWQSEIGANR
jgi:iron(III) transport system substrate-binding protein